MQDQHAVAGENNTMKLKQAILAAHPAVVTYDGAGDPDKPGSFRCAVPN